MGSGTYSSISRSIRANDLGYHTKSTTEIFQQKSINNAMDPHGVVTRESRDSEEHPNSLAIILGLDVTGSMGSIPHALVKEGLPSIMDKIIENGELDPQVLFLGLGDHCTDRAPLQVGQFESSDELLDKWLTDVYLEGGGGANDGESYLLAWLFAAYNTTIDCFEKRGRKGLLFTIGDEPVLSDISANQIKNIMGLGQYEDMTAARLLEKAREKYDVYHIHVKQTSSGARQRVMDGWKQLISDNLLIVERSDDVATVIADTVLRHKQGKAAVVETVTGDVESEEIL